MVLETNRSRLLNVWGGAEEEQRKSKSGCPSPPYSLLLVQAVGSAHRFPAAASSQRAVAQRLGGCGCHYRGPF